MTRKDYIAIAASIAATRRATIKWQGVAIDVLDAAARGLAEMLGRTNPRFDRERFLRECHNQDFVSLRSCGCPRGTDYRIVDGRTICHACSEVIQL